MKIAIVGAGVGGTPEVVHNAEKSITAGVRNVFMPMSLNALLFTMRKAIEAAISKEKLHELYWKQKKSAPEIATICGCGSTTVYRLMNKYNIKRRSLADSQKKLFFTRELIEDLYINKGLSSIKIGEMLGCNTQTILNNMLDCGIPRRTKSENGMKVKISKDELYELYWNREMSVYDIAAELGCVKETVIRKMREHNIRCRNCFESSALRRVSIPKEELKDIYWNKGLSSSEIAKRFGCNAETIRRRMAEFDIPLRPPSSLPLEKNPAWKGGISFEPYCPKFNEAFKESIREKFGRVCFLCPTTEEENGRKLAVHHVSYNKDCLCDDSDCEFVPLCLECHGNSNHDREYWEAVIMEKLEAIKCESGL